MLHSKELRFMVLGFLTVFAVKVMASDYKVSEFSLKAFEQVKLLRNKFVVFWINADKEICVEAMGPPDGSYDEYLNAIMRSGADECRIGLYHYNCKVNCADLNVTLFLMRWCEKTAKPKFENMYMAAFPILQQALPQVTDIVVANNYTELEIANVKQQVLRNRKAKGSAKQ